MGKARTAADIIAEVEKRSGPAVPPKAALDMLRDITAHNDQCIDRSSRVSIERVRVVLREDYGLKWGKESIARICREHLGRTNWSAP